MADVLGSGTMDLLLSLPLLEDDCRLHGAPRPCIIDIFSGVRALRPNIFHGCK